MGQHFSKNLKQKLSDGGIIALIAVFGLTATGCSLFGGSGNNETKQPQVRIWRYNQGVDPFQEKIAEFQKANSTVKITYQKRDLDDYEFSALKSLAGRLGPDIWSIPSDWIGDYQDQVIPLPDNFFYKEGEDSGTKPVDAVKQLYPEGIYEQLLSTDKTKVYGVPTNVDTLQLYVNMDLLSESLQEFRKSQGANLKDEVYQPVRQLLNKPAVTWTDVVEQTRYITRRDGNTITRSAIALGSANNIANPEDILQLLILQNDSKILSDDRKSVLFNTVQSTPSGGQVRPGQKALEFFTSFSDPSKSTYSWNPSMPQALDAFGQGKVAMVIGYTDFGKQLKIKYPKFRPTVAPVPQISSAQEAVNMVKFSVETVTKTADNSAAAFAFLKTYTNDSSARSLAREQQLFTPFKARLEQDEAFQGKQIMTGQSVYKVNHSQFDAVFRQIIVDSSQNGISPADALTTGADKIDSLLNPKPEE
jgi:ABC-type glycerol-3-phosphate transport system substrate-binding protein